MTPAFLPDTAPLHSVDPVGSHGDRCLPGRQLAVVSKPLQCQACHGRSLHDKMMAVWPHTGTYRTHLPRAFDVQYGLLHTKDSKMSQSSQRSSVFLSLLAENLPETARVARAGNTQDTTTMALDPALSTAT